MLRFVGLSVKYVLDINWISPPCYSFFSRRRCDDDDDSWKKVKHIIAITFFIMHANVLIPKKHTLDEAKVVFDNTTTGFSFRIMLLLVLVVVLGRTVAVDIS